MDSPPAATRTGSAAHGCAAGPASSTRSRRLTAQMVLIRAVWTTTPCVPHLDIVARHNISLDMNARPRTTSVLAPIIPPPLARRTTNRFFAWFNSAIASFLRTTNSGRAAALARCAYRARIVPFVTTAFAGLSAFSRLFFLFAFAL